MIKFPASSRETRNLLLAYLHVCNGTILIRLVNNASSYASFGWQTRFTMLYL